LVVWLLILFCRSIDMKMRYFVYYMCCLFIEQGLKSAHLRHVHSRLWRILTSLFSY
jgi:hypothetical protein